MSTRVMAGRFRLGRELGRGGMGTVHEALELTLGRPVAIKVLREGIAADEQQVARFEREARAAACLAHPNVVGVTELIRDPVLGLGLVMELLVGESLHARLRRGPLAPAEAKSVFMQALDGLAAAHAAHMVHRDIKPSNVFLVPLASGHLVKLLDFGIVKLAEQGGLPKLTTRGAVLGTPAYMSPEQLACETVDARSDVYSIGACLYEALSGRAPYEAEHTPTLVAAVGAGPPPDLRDIGANVSTDLVHVVRTAMSRDPGGRYQSAAAMRDALRNAELDEPPSAHSEPRNPRAHTPRMPRRRTEESAPTTPLSVPTNDRSRTVAAAVLIGAVLVVAALVARAPTRDAEPTREGEPTRAPTEIADPPVAPTLTTTPHPRGTAPPPRSLPFVEPPPSPLPSSPVLVEPSTASLSVEPPSTGAPSVEPLPSGVEPPEPVRPSAIEPRRAWRSEVGASPRRPTPPRPVVESTEERPPPPSGPRPGGEGILNPFAD